MALYRRLFKTFGAQDWWPGETPFEVAVGAILTQNTNWSNVKKAIGNLKNARALDPHVIHKMQHEPLAELIRPSGYYNVKARRLKSFIKYLVEEHDGNVQAMGEIGDVRSRLLAVNGIGRETADSIILYAIERPIFVIDAYTKRILSRHGFLDIDEDYDDFQTLFHDSLQRDTALYNEFHALFVMTGKHYCKPIPKCEGCPLQDFRTSISR